MRWIVEAFNRETGWELVAGNFLSEDAANSHAKELCRRGLPHVPYRTRLVASH